MNNVTLVGRLATDPRLEATNGNPICTFRLAVDRGKQDGADFIPIKCFGAAAENHAKYLTKGRLISLTGRISHSQWADKETGDPRERYEIIGSYIGYLDSAKPEPATEPAQEVPAGHEPF